MERRAERNSVPLISGTCSFSRFNSETRHNANNARKGNKAKKAYRAKKVNKASKNNQDIKPAMANMADKIHPHWRSSFPKCNLSQLYCICMIENNISSLIQQIRTESEPQHQQLSNYFKTAITTSLTVKKGIRCCSCFLKW